MSRRHPHIALAVVVGFLFAGIPTISAAADPIWHASNFTVLGIGGNLWWNYDSFATIWDPNVNPVPASYQTDWPETQFFWHDGTQNEINLLLLCDPNHSFTQYCQGGGSSHYLRGLDNNDNVWRWYQNSFGGRKNGNPCNGWDIHYVNYPGRNAYNEAFYNTTWGFWMPTSTHYDYNDGNGCTGNTGFGYSDQAERNLENAETQAGMSPYQPGQNWYNYEAYRVEYCQWSDHVEFHVWENVNYTVPVCVFC